jgi:hypothetical protein
VVALVFLSWRETNRDALLVGIAGMVSLLQPSRVWECLPLLGLETTFSCCLKNRLLDMVVAGVAYRLVALEVFRRRTWKGLDVCSKP